MRVQTVYCKYRYQAAKECPWASRMIKVDSGEENKNAWKCFESISDYETWRKQK